jgi:dihydroxy-acid dehydratase
MRGKIKLDIVLLFIGLLLLATLIAFFIGLFPYPFGIVILSLALAGRILQLRSGG